MNDLISIIVPVYGVEKYLKRCIDSILRQTYKKIEILLVDDGSPDACGSICDEYAAKDSRVRAFHKQNGGLSDARNYGIDRAKGDYLCFVDPDDYIADDYCRLMYETSIKENADIVICNYAEFKSDTCKAVTRQIYDVSVITSYEALKRLYSPDGKMYPVAWNKLYKKSVVADIRFPIGVINEDEFTTYKYILNSERIAVLDSVLYYYYNNENSITSNKDNLLKFDLFVALLERRKYFDALGLPEDLIMLTNKSYLNRIIFRNRELKKINHEKYRELLSDFRLFYRVNKKKVRGQGYLIYYFFPGLYYKLVDFMNI